MAMIVDTYSSPKVLYGSSIDDVLEVDEDDELLLRFCDRVLREAIFSRKSIYSES